MTALVVLGMCVQMCFPDMPVVELEATAYTACDPGDPCLGLTASQSRADHARNIVAVNTDRLPMGAWVLLEGEYYKAEDRICHRRCEEVGADLDILVATRREALTWGRRRVPAVVMFGG